MAQRIFSLLLRELNCLQPLLNSLALAALYGSIRCVRHAARLFHKNCVNAQAGAFRAYAREHVAHCNGAQVRAFAKKPRRDRFGSNRSEEHTSELQSPDHLLCPLLLEKKK